MPSKLYAKATFGEGVRPLGGIGRPEAARSFITFLAATEFLKGGWTNGSGRGGHAPIEIGLPAEFPRAQAVNAWTRC